MRRALMCFVVWSIGCGVQSSAGVTEASATEALRGDDRQGHHDDDDQPNPNPMLFPKSARPYGRSWERWSELSWAYLYAQPFDHNPVLDTTGADCAIGQAGPVWFLPAVPGSTLGTSVTRRCTIPHHRALLLQLASALNDYPCPDPAFQPAPGQSLYDFLIEPIRPLFDHTTGFEVLLDGVAVHDPLSYRFASHDLFSFTGDLSMQAYDTCVTGKPQPAVIDGFYLLFKPLAPGEHTIVVNGHDMHGVPVTLTELLTVR
jgi:hypothetical protein